MGVDVNIYFQRSLQGISAGLFLPLLNDLGPRNALSCKLLEHQKDREYVYLEVRLRATEVQGTYHCHIQHPHGTRHL